MCGLFARMLSVVNSYEHDMDVTHSSGFRISLMNAGGSVTAAVFRDVVLSEG